ncbi:MAG: hypothetical protein H6814_11705, partial [Phycisphaeraceae bacterium]|nr:hypothetical protein [Phycisphaeraceae bacterium]
MSAAVLFGLIAFKADLNAPVIVAAAGVMICVLTIAVVFPYGAIVDRAIARLRKAVDEARASERRTSISSSGCMGALALSIDEMITAMVERVEDARNELR